MGGGKRTRADLAGLVLAAELDQSAVRLLAASLDWRIPASLLTIVVAGGRDPAAQPQTPGSLALRLPPEALVMAANADRVHAIAPALTEWETQRLSSWAEASELLVVLGPTLPWHEAALSLARAQALTDLLEADAGGSPVPEQESELTLHIHNVSEHRLALLCTSDRGMLREFVAEVLAPLAQVPAPRRGELERTLLAWLDCSGYRDAARRLNVHPKTVQYRVAQLRRLFDGHLDDSRKRSELHLAARLAGLARRG